jgi:hypothetical protein
VGTELAGDALMPREFARRRTKKTLLLNAAVIGAGALLACGSDDSGAAAAPGEGDASTIQDASEDASDATTPYTPTNVGVPYDARPTVNADVGYVPESSIPEPSDAAAEASGEAGDAVSAVDAEDGG